MKYFRKKIIYTDNLTTSLSQEVHLTKSDIQKQLLMEFYTLQSANQSLLELNNSALIMDPENRKQREATSSLAPMSFFAIRTETLGPLSQMLPKELVHQSLEGLRGIGHSEGHHDILVVSAIGGNDGRLVSILLGDWH